MYKALPDNIKSSSHFKVDQHVFISSKYGYFVPFYTDFDLKTFRPFWNFKSFPAVPHRACYYNHSPDRYINWTISFHSFTVVFTKLWANTLIKFSFDCFYMMIYSTGCIFRYFRCSKWQKTTKDFVYWLWKIAIPHL